MNQLSPRWRRVGRDLAGAGTLLSALVLLVVVFGGPVRHALAGAEDAGTVQLLTPSTAANPNQPIPSGGSATVFALTPPSGAACPGSAVDTPSYRWQTFLVAAPVDVAALTYSSGPNPVGSAFVSTLYDSAGGNPVANKNPSANPLGQITGIPTISFAAYGPDFVPAGDYKIGFACTQAGTTVKYWTGYLTIAKDTNDSPSQLTWTVTAPPTPTTTVASTTTTGASATSTTSTVKAATTTTVKSTTTTVASSSTTTATSSTSTASSTSSSAVASATTVAFGSNASNNVQSGSASPSGASLASTGTNTWPIVIWGILLLVFGRIVILLARPVRLRPPEER